MSRLFHLSACLALVGLLASAPAIAKPAAAKPAAPKETRATQVLKQLIAGNQRYLTHHEIHRSGEAEVRHKVANHQQPVAVILGCADSRVPPEIVFDQGLGDLFVVRVAGNIVDDAVLGSIEYAVGHLNVPLVMVMGHERCGAVTAALHSEDAHDHILTLVKQIQPAIKEARATDKDPIDALVRANVRHEVHQLEAQPYLARMMRERGLRIVGSRYDLDTGKVDVLEP